MTGRLVETTDLLDAVRFTLDGEWPANGSAIAAVITWARRRGGYGLGENHALLQAPAGEDLRTFARRLVTEWRLAGCPYTDGRMFVDEDHAQVRSR